MEKKLEAARQVAREAYAAQGVKSEQYEAAMDKVRAIISAIEEKRAPEEFCSVDSGSHRTRLLDGRVI